jgi:hypothetical protein
LPGVFISYRRQDSAGYAGRLFDILSSHIGTENTFMDIDTIEGGDKFRTVIHEKIESSSVLLAVIGSHWLTITDKDGNRRLDNPNDFVRLEIGKALKRGIRVVPVLVGGARVPRSHELPDDLRPLSERQALEIRDSDFHVDSQQLADLVLKTLGGAGFRPGRTNLQRFFPAAVWGAIAAIVIVSSILFLRPFGQAKSEGARARSVEISLAGGLHAADLAGKWNAAVKYDWGDSHRETFDFRVDGSDLSGTAGFLGVGRAIMDGKLAGNRITFFTTSLTTASSSEQVAQDKHLYKGTITGDIIQFTMVTDSRVSTHPPIDFVAKKLQNN